MPKTSEVQHAGPTVPLEYQLGQVLIDDRDRNKAPYFELKSLNFEKFFPAVIANGKENFNASATGLSRPSFDIYFSGAFAKELGKVYMTWIKASAGDAVGENLVQHAKKHPLVVQESKFPDKITYTISAPGLSTESVVITVSVTPGSVESKPEPIVVKTPRKPESIIETPVFAPPTPDIAPEPIALVDVLSPEEPVETVKRPGIEHLIIPNSADMIVNLFGRDITTALEVQYKKYKQELAELIRRSDETWRWLDAGIKNAPENRERLQAELETITADRARYQSERDGAPKFAADNDISDEELEYVLGTYDADIEFCNQRESEILEELNFLEGIEERNQREIERLDETFAHNKAALEQRNLYEMGDTLLNSRLADRKYILSLVDLFAEAVGSNDQVQFVLPTTESGQLSSSVESMIVESLDPDNFSPAEYFVLATLLPKVFTFLTNQAEMAGLQDFTPICWFQVQSGKWELRFETKIPDPDATVLQKLWNAPAKVLSGTNNNHVVVTNNPGAEFDYSKPITIIGLNGAEERINPETQETVAVVEASKVLAEKEFIKILYGLSFNQVTFSTELKSTHARKLIGTSTLSQQSEGVSFIHPVFDQDAFTALIKEYRAELPKGQKKNSLQFIVHLDGELPLYEIVDTSKSPRVIVCTLALDFTPEQLFHLGRTNEMHPDHLRQLEQSSLAEFKAKTNQEALVAAKQRHAEYREGKDADSTLANYARAKSSIMLEDYIATFKAASPTGGHFDAFTIDTLIETAVVNLKTEVSAIHDQLKGFAQKNRAKEQVIGFFGTDIEEVLNFNSITEVLDFLNNFKFAIDEQSMRVILAEHMDASAETVLMGLAIDPEHQAFLNAHFTKSEQVALFGAYKKRITTFKEPKLGQRIIGAKSRALQEGEFEQIFAQEIDTQFLAFVQGFVEFSRVFYEKTELDTTPHFTIRTSEQFADMLDMFMHQFRVGLIRSREQKGMSVDSYIDTVNLGYEPLKVADDVLSLLHLLDTYITKLYAKGQNYSGKQPFGGSGYKQHTPQMGEDQYRTAALKMRQEILALLTTDAEPRIVDRHLKSQREVYYMRSRSEVATGLKMLLTEPKFAKHRELLASIENTEKPSKVALFKVEYQQGSNIPASRKLQEQIDALTRYFQKIETIKSPSQKAEEVAQCVRVVDALISRLLEAQAEINKISGGKHNFVLEMAGFETALAPEVALYNGMTGISSMPRSASTEKSLSIILQELLTARYTLVKTDLDDTVNAINSSIFDKRGARTPFNYRAYIPYTRTAAQKSKTKLVKPQANAPVVATTSPVFTPAFTPPAYLTNQNVVEAPSGTTEITYASVRDLILDQLFRNGLINSYDDFVEGERPYISLVGIIKLANNNPIVFRDKLKNWFINNYFKPEDGVDINLQKIKFDEDATKMSAAVFNQLVGIPTKSKTVPQRQQPKQSTPTNSTIESSQSNKKAAAWAERVVATGLARPFNQSEIQQLAQIFEQNATKSDTANITAWLKSLNIAWLPVVQNLR